MATIAVLTSNESGANSLIDINSNFSNLNSALAGLATLASPTFTGTVTLPSSTVLTTPKVVTSLTDTNGNVVFGITPTASAINYIRITNAATGVAGPIVAADGETNVDLKITGKGTGKVHRTSSVYGDITSYSPTAAGTATLTLNTSNTHEIAMPAGNITIALSNEAVGQYFVVRVLQDATGSRTVTWFTTIKWSGGVAPTLTTTANKADTFGFYVRSAGNYDGVIVGQAF